MADEVAASTMVTYFTNCMAQLRGRAVYVQFSNHKELKTDQTHSNAVSPTKHGYNSLLAGFLEIQCAKNLYHFLLSGGSESSVYKG
jgi:hypothetical protein